MNKTAKDTLSKSCRLVGRRNLYRAARFLMSVARGDVANDPLSNGESMVQTIALRIADSPALVIDVGANVGRWTGGLLEISRNLNIPVNVHSFEPCRETFARLTDAFGSSSNVTLVRQGCSRCAGVASMHVYGDGYGTNSLAEPTDDRKAVTEDVQLTTIDLYCQSKGIRRVDLLKIDAEGHDFEVIAGAAEMLDRQAVRILQFEYNHRWIGCRNYLRDAFSFLSPRGYIIGKLIGARAEFYPYWRWELETFSEGNYIACLMQDAQQFHPGDPSWLFQSGEDASQPNE